MTPTRRAAAPKPAAAPGLRILKKYPNRRLYDTVVSRYVTLAEVKRMVLEGTAFEVREAKSGEDLTRSILLQIILEEETGGVPMFSTTMLSQIIRFYGHAMQGMMGSYLEKNLQTFTDIQGRVAEQTKGLYGAGVGGAHGRSVDSDLWSQYLRGQAPVVQNLMASYLDQSRDVFLQMQEQMARQTGTIFPGLVPTIPPTAPKTEPAATATARKAKPARKR